MFKYLLHFLYYRPRLAIASLITLILFLSLSNLTSFNLSLALLLSFGAGILVFIISMSQHMSCSSPHDMAFQTSDVQITGRHIRRVVLAHSMIAFFFNVVIIAITINVLAGVV